MRGCMKINKTEKNILSYLIVSKITLKRMIKMILRLLLRKNLDTIMRLIDDADVVSFDMFDTLVARKCMIPENVYKITAAKCVEKKVIPEGYDFLQVRLEAELEARREKKYEVNMEDIYSKIKIVNDNLKKKIEKIEIDTEVEVSISTSVGQELFEYAKKRGKTIVISSDMYLPKDTIERILELNGYFGWNEIFLSSVYGIKKKDGLYEKLVEKYRMSEILHIGDDVVADLIAAKKSGIQAVLF